MFFFPCHEHDTLIFDITRDDDGTLREVRQYRSTAYQVYSRWISSYRVQFFNVLIAAAT